MKIIKFLLVPCLGLALVVPRQAAARPKKQPTSKAQKKKGATKPKKQPTRQETLKWIQSTVAAYGEYNITGGEQDWTGTIRGACFRGALRMVLSI